MEITQRQKIIFKTIVEEFTRCAEPVGSKTLMELLDFPVSSATIRNEMATLEKLGLLEKTHTSSGRIPSQKGYRYYVEHLMEADLDASTKNALQQVFSERHYSLEEVVQKSCDILSHMTNLTSVVLGPDSRHQTLQHVQLIPINNQSAVAIIVTDQGHTENKVFQFGTDVSMQDIQNCTDLLNDQLVGTPIEDVVDKMKEKKLPVCKPLAVPDDRVAYGEDIYNIKLAIKRTKGEEFDIIGNDITFDNEQRIYVMTGPNRGGKTTFTQAVGHCFLLAQAGIYVPATKFNYSPVDNIYTHFPADENDTVDLGRLGEESKRLSDIFKVATDKSLLLLNESLATTNVAEGVFIAKDVIKAMAYLGVRSVFNTHMHELAHHLDEYNSDDSYRSKVQSLVTGMKDGHRSFKCEIAPPQGVSYAKDIAEKYGVTYDQIKKNIDNR